MRALALVLFLALFGGACTSAEPTAASAEALLAVATPVAGGPSASPTAGPTPAPTVPTSSPAPTPTPTPGLAEPTQTQTPTGTPEPTETIVPTPTPEPVETPALTATAVPSPEQSPPPPTATQVPDLPPSDYTGEVRAIRTGRGAVVAVRGQTNQGYLVVTPCYNLASIAGGLTISGPLDVLIDPGHGGDEPGAVGPNGLKESTVNLRVAELVRAEMIERGYTVELTRYGDERVAIQSRAELANALAPRVFMSIHHNGGFPEPFPVAGTEVFVQLDDPESARLGGLVFEEIQAAFQGVDAAWMGSPETHGVAWRMNQDGTDLYGVLRRTPNLVSVLTEAMFISTEAEAELLAKPETLQTEAVALANALERWFETRDEGLGYIEGVVFQGDLGNGGGTEGCIDPPLD